MTEGDMLPRGTGVCAEYIRNACDALFRSGLPADRFLAEAFRKDRRCGSGDRKRIRNCVFRYFRLRGCIGETVPVTPELAAQLLQEPFPGDLAPDENKILPAWCRDEWMEEIRNDYPRLTLSRPPLWIRVCKGKKEGLLHSLAPYGAEGFDPVPEAVKLTCGTSNLTGTFEYRNGDFEIQDIASQCIGLAADARPGETWWDACAGAGGKTLQLADRMQDQGILVSSDIRGDETEKEKQNRIRRAGIRMVSLRTMDASASIPEEGAVFDGVLADVPCSSSGRWRRNPELRWTLTHEKLENFTCLQSAILENVSRAVRPGGLLVYATCSLFRKENTSAVEDFLARHSDFALEDFSHPLTGKMTGGIMVVHPGTADSDGTFAARMRRRTGGSR